MNEREQNKISKRIAIIGAGFCGLAAAYHLATSSQIVDVYYKDGGASAIAIGLLHPFAGKRANRSAEDALGIAATRKLLKISSHFQPRAPYIEKGIYRLAINDEAEKDYRSCHEHYPEEVEWVESYKVKQILPACAEKSGIFIKNGVAVYCDRYLLGLKAACENLNVTFIEKNIRSLTELEGYDQIVLASGSSFVDDRHLYPPLPLNKVKGQLLELAWPQHLSPLAYPVSSNILALMSEDNQRCFVGATYERDYTSHLPDLKAAKDELMPKIASLIPGLEKAEVLKCNSGFRVTAPSRMPFLKQLDHKTWILTAMSSKGLLYHALYAEKLVEQMLTIK